MFFSDVACERRQQFRAGGLPRTRLRRDGYVAELIEDRRSGSQLVHCVIQQEDSPEVLLYAQFRTFEAAWAWAGRELEEAFVTNHVIGDRGRLLGRLCERLKG